MRPLRPVLVALSATLAVALVPGPASAAPARDAALTTDPSAGRVAQRTASRCRPKKYERTVASSSQIVVLYYERNDRDSQTITERRMACSRKTGRRARVWSRSYDSLDMSANSAGSFRAAGTYVAWVEVTGDRFGPYYPTVKVRRFGARRTRSFNVPVSYADSPSVRSLAVSSTGDVAFTTRSRSYGDVLRVLDGGGVARRYDQGDSRSIGSLAFDGAGALMWRHAGIAQRRTRPAADRCRALLPGFVREATADALVTTDSHTGIQYGCLRATARVVRLPGAVLDAGSQGSTTVAGRYAATIRSPQPLRSVVEVTDLETGRTLGTPFALPNQIYGPGSSLRPSLQLLPDGRLVLLADNDGKQPMVLRALDGSTRVLDGRPGTFNPILDDGLVLYQANSNRPTLAGRLRIAPSALRPGASR